MAKHSNFHESFAEHDLPIGPSDRKFGYSVGGILAALGVLKAIFMFSWIAIVLMLIGATLIACAFFSPSKLAILNKGWMKLGLVLFHIVNPLVMGIIYLICFIPGGIIMRLLKHDPMNREFDSVAQTYWVKKKPSELPDPMKYQF
jgi:hypothetical protein